jgi:hypothetical protein
MPEVDTSAGTRHVGRIMVPPETFGAGCGAFDIG